jgi:peptidyl-prolyl cis-trans isomerase SurA
MHYPYKSVYSLLFAVVVVLAPTLGQGAPRAGGEELLDRVMIVVDNSVILQSEVEERVAAARTNLARRNIAMPPDTVIRRQVIDGMILEQLQLDLAKKRGVEVSETEIDGALQNIARQNGMSLPFFLQKVKKDGVSVDRLREDVRRQRQIQQLVELEVNRQIQVSESEVDTFLGDENRRGKDADYNLSHILIPVGESASSNERKQAADLAGQVREKLLAGEPFEKMAVTYSKGPNALKGGGLGWREAGRLPDVFIRALESIRPGEVTQVLESANGYHLLRLNAKRGGGSSGVVTQTRVRHILLKPAENRDITTATAELKRIRSRALSGEKFEDLAKKFSEDSSAKEGGNLGWMIPGQLVNEFETAMNQLKPGEISQPVQTRFGVHLIQVVDRRSKDVGDQQQRLNARQQIHQRKAEERMQEWLRQLRDQAYVEIIPQESS